MRLPTYRYQSSEPRAWQSFLGTSAIFSFSVTENILLPASLADKSVFQKKVKFLMERLSLAKIESVMPLQLSGREFRRIAVVRSLLLQSDFIFADRPAAALDDENSKGVLHFSKKLLKTALLY